MIDKSTEKYCYNWINQHESLFFLIFESMMCILKIILFLNISIILIHVHSLMEGTLLTSRGEGEVAETGD